MKRIAAWMLTVLFVVASVASLIPTYTALASNNDYSIIKVKISNGTPSSQSARVIGKFVMNEDRGFNIAAGAMTIKNNGGKLSITSGGKTTTVGNTITLVNSDTSSRANLIEMKGFNGTNQYLGDMIFTASGSGIMAINKLPMEQYVVGVVAIEMGSSFHLEALKAQAVAARSYAATYISRRKNSAYHIVDGPTEQAYIGYKSNAKINQSVEQTSGQMLEYNGQVIEAYYSASNGGQTDVAQNAWGGGAATDKKYPYFTINADPYDLKQCAIRNGLQEMVFVPQSLKGNQSKANPVIWGDIMAAFGLPRSTGEKSLSGARINSISPTKKNSATPDSWSYKAVTFNATVNGMTKNVTIDLTKLRSRGVFTKSNLRMQSYESGSKNGVDGWYLTSRRFGHGIGMSQWGAHQMALEGIGYAAILDFYYRGVHLSTADTNAGWHAEGDDVYMYDESGNKVYGWHEYAGATYYLDENTGVMARGWKEMVGQWYYFSDNGARRYGWLSSKETKASGATRWYYLDPQTGIMVANKSESIDGSIYAFNANGVMQKNGWSRVGGNWYYLSSKGTVITGWVKDYGVWYYNDPQSGAMLTGVQEVDGEVYVLEKNGAMARSGWKSLDGQWYYLSRSGAAAKGWQSIGGAQYYFDTRSAVMATGEKQIDGQIFVFSKNGVVVSSRAVVEETSAEEDSQLKTDQPVTEHPEQQETAPQQQEVQQNAPEQQDIAAQDEAPAREDADEPEQTGTPGPSRINYEPEEAIESVEPE